MRCRLTNIALTQLGLLSLQVNVNLNKITHLKSEGIQKNYYFDYNSPTYERLLI